MIDNKIILFESFPNFSGSPLEIYNELKKRGYDKKYELVWASDNTAFEGDYKTVNYFGKNANKSSILDKTKIIIDSNNYIYKKQNNFRLHVRHGCSFKNCIDYYAGVGPCDAILTTSSEMKEIDERVWPNYLKGKFEILGNPSNDRMFHAKDLYETGFLKYLTGSDHRFSKIIGWLPTYRQHRNGASPYRTEIKFPFGLPTIYSEEILLDLNDFLNTNDVLLIVQMHHAQSQNFINLKNRLSNLIFISDEDKKKFNILTQDLLAGFDGLVTDYSAVYHEYILLNRPIGITVDDINEYGKRVGFCYKFSDWIKGEYIFNSSMLKNFINDVLIENDVHKNERQNSLNKIHKYKDDKSASRVVDFLESKNLL